LLGWRRWLLLIALYAAGALYFFQSATLAPDHTDEGLTLQYIDAMTHGQRPYYDFVDAYGIVNWVMPVVRASHIEHGFRPARFYPAPSVAWDWQKYDFGLRIGIIRGIDLTAEYTHHDIQLFVGKIYENEWLLTLRAGF